MRNDAEVWMWKYNNERPHSSLTPGIFIEIWKNQKTKQRRLFHISTKSSNTNNRNSNKELYF
jgi:putative transposase